MHIRFNNCNLNYNILGATVVVIVW